MNDSLHLVYYTTDTQYLRAEDLPLAGQGVTELDMPNGVTLVADLYAGTSSGSLSLMSTTTFGVQEGRLASLATVLQGIPGGSPVYFEVQIRDSAFATEALSLAGGSYGGSSGLFTAVPGSSIAYNSIVRLDFPAFSTWAVGTFDMSSQSGLTGARGAIQVSLIPEPGAVLLAGLSICAWIVRRRSMN
jgi:hypothetical protein